MSAGTPDLHDCRRCRRLTAYLQKQKKSYPDYHNAPVAPSGDPSASLLIVGLAPGLHGANASGIPFRGDSAGDVLYRYLAEYGYARPSTVTNDEFELIDCRITNAVKCLPPNNLPNAREISHCNRYLKQEIKCLSTPLAILALGGIAHKAVLKALDLTLAGYRFAHMAEHQLKADTVLLDSYHCSRYNMNTGRLSELQFSAVIRRARQLTS